MIYNTYWVVYTKYAFMQTMLKWTHWQNREIKFDNEKWNNEKQNWQKSKKKKLEEKWVEEKATTDTGSGVNTPATDTATQ